jgi:glycerophosphoryl diester phosphodiesterase
MPRPLVIAHRGASGYEVENSLAAFRAAHAMGADAVELDVHATADGALLVHHDEMVGHHHIAHCSLKEVREHPLKNGEPVPTLEEALAVIHPHLIAFVEIKSLAPKLDDKLFATFDAAPAPDRIAVHGFDHRIIHRLGERRPHLKRGLLSSSYPIWPIRVLEDADATALWQNCEQVDEALVEAVHAAGMSVYSWTVDGPAAMQRQLALGVDGICTNYPDRGRGAVDSLPR